MKDVSLDEASGPIMPSVEANTTIVRDPNFKPLLDNKMDVVEETIGTQKRIHLSLENNATRGDLQSNALVIQTTAIDEDVHSSPKRRKITKSNRQHTSLGNTDAAHGLQEIVSTKGCPERDFSVKSIFNACLGTNTVFEYHYSDIILSQKSNGREEEKAQATLESDHIKDEGLKTYFSKSVEEHMVPLMHIVPNGSTEETSENHSDKNLTIGCLGNRLSGGIGPGISGSGLVEELERGGKVPANCHSVEPVFESRNDNYTFQNTASSPNHPEEYFEEASGVKVDKVLNATGDSISATEHVNEFIPYGKNEYHDGLSSVDAACKHLKQGNVELETKTNKYFSKSNLELLKDDHQVTSKKDDPREISHPLPEGHLIDCSKKKLLILDVNGLLADIVVNLSENYTPDTTIGMRTVFKRPFFDDFMQFCLENFNVGIWSSRIKKNVDSVLDVLMGDSKKRLLFCWDQSQCTHTNHFTIENSNKPLVLKELTKLWEKKDPKLPWKEGDYNKSNTLLLDDSPYKALRNPPYTAIFPETYSFKDTEDVSLGPGGALRVYLEGLAEAENVQTYVKLNPIGQPAITKESPDWDFYKKVLDTISHGSGGDDKSPISHHRENRCPGSGNSPISHDHENRSQGHRSPSRDDRNRSWDYCSRSRDGRNRSRDYWSRSRDDRNRSWDDCRSGGNKSWDYWSRSQADGNRYGYKSLVDGSRSWDSWFRSQVDGNKSGDDRSGSRDGGSSSWDYWSRFQADGNSSRDYWSRFQADGNRSRDKSWVDGNRSRDKSWVDENRSRDKSWVDGNRSRDYWYRSGADGNNNSGDDKSRSQDGRSRSQADGSRSGYDGNRSWDKFRDDGNRFWNYSPRSQAHGNKFRDDRCRSWDNWSGSQGDGNRSRDSGYRHEDYCSRSQANRYRSRSPRFRADRNTFGDTSRSDGREHWFRSQADENTSVNCWSRPRAEGNISKNDGNSSQDYMSLSRNDGNRSWDYWSKSQADGNRAWDYWSKSQADGNRSQDYRCEQILMWPTIHSKSTADRSQGQI